MFKFENSHIFTGYLKQLLSSVNLPMCRIYTREFADYLSCHGKEDPRVIESFNTLTYEFNGKQKASVGASINYLKNNGLYSYLLNYSQDSKEVSHKDACWKQSSSVFYNSDKNIPGLTRVLNSPGTVYDTTTHEYLGEYLRFMRDYHNINLMSLYNCFNNKVCTNVYYQHPITKNLASTFDSKDSKYRIYAIPVKLFCDYTIAIDCSYGLELFCGLYNATLDTTARGRALIAKTYQKVNQTIFNQPILYDKLNVENWKFKDDFAIKNGFPNFMSKTSFTRCDLANREQDLKLFIKVPSSCKSSIVILEGDFRSFNDIKYVPPGTYLPDGTLLNTDFDDETFTTTKTAWEYQQNHTVINFGDEEDRLAGLDINKSPFTPIGKLQLLMFNTGESYPFADRLVEYLCNSAITPIDEIADNIKRAQKVMSQNKYYFKIDGVWEDKMQKIIYDYLTSTGPIELANTAKGVKLEDRRRGIHQTLGHTTKSMLYDVLGYVDKDAEKWYASWTNKDNKAVVRDTIQNVDIYDGLYDI